MRWTGLALIPFALLSAGSTARADKCTGAKLKAVGRKEARLLACQAKVAATNDTSGLAACESKIRGTFAATFAKAGTCAGEQTRCESIADFCDSAMAADLTDTFPSTCEAAKRKAAGRLADAEVVCYSKAAKRGRPVDASCITKAQGKFGTALVTAGACPDGYRPASTPQDHVEYNCVRPAVATDSGGMVTDVCPTTITTTTTTTTTVPRVPCSGGDPNIAPVCQGTCPAVSNCRVHTRFISLRECDCFQPDVVSCGDSAAPQCSGVCFDGDVCQAFRRLTDAGIQNVCSCVASDSVCQPGLPICQSIGRCPPNQLCQIDEAIYPRHTNPTCGCVLR